MVDQMVQAARSNKQNIVEGSSEPVSKKSEIKLLGVARASFQELLEDYEDFLRQRGLRQWDKDSASAKEIRALAYRTDRSYETYKPYLSNAESAANTAICMINQASYLLDRQIRVLEEKFVKEGGWTEKMFKRRVEYRSNRSN
jgi:four helix bundle suffix protein